MKKTTIIYYMSLLGALTMLQSCARTSNDVWEDTKSAGRHMQQGVRAAGGKGGDSRQIRSKNDFSGAEDQESQPAGDFESSEYNNMQAAEFVPLEDQANDELAMADIIARQPRETPGEPGSSIPSIESFKDPSTIPGLAGVFKTVYFEYDSSLIKGSNNLQSIRKMADYMREHPNLYVFIEGHTDERGPQAYNLALGARRANSIRNMLIGDGVSPDNLFTISYGKERPVIMEHHEEGWEKNRRGEFKVYVR